MMEKKKGKARRRRNESGSSEEDGVNLVIIIVAFISGLCLIARIWHSSFEEHISREFLTAEFNLISYKAIRSRGKLKILYLFIITTVFSVACSIAIFLQFIQVISIFHFF